MLRRTVLSAIFIFVLVSSYGQDNHPSKEQLDTEVSRLFDYSEDNLVSSLRRAHEIDKIATKEGFHNVRIRSLNLISVIETDKGNYHLADSTLSLAHNISIVYNDSMLMGSTLVNWAQLDMEQSDFLTATDKMRRAKAIFESQKRLKGEIHCAYLLAQIHFHRQLYDDAFDDLIWGVEKSAHIKDTVLQAAGLVNLGIIQRKQGLISEAIKSFKKSSSLLSQCLEKGDIIRPWLNLADIYADQGNETQSLDYYNRVRFSNRFTPTEIELAEAYIAHSTLSKQLEDYNSSITYADSALQITERLGKEKMTILALDIKRQTYAASGNHKVAYELLNLKNALQDSTVNELNKREINELDKKYRDAEKDREILMLQASKLEQDKTVSRLILVALISLLILSVFGGLYVFRNRQRLLNTKFDKLELEQKALKAQMNPHFLFNALNSIQSSILNEDRMIAYEFHNKFTKLMRRILTLSREEFVSMRDELETLKLYIDLERYRSDNAFSVEFDIDKSINLDLQKTPSLLFQPYVENAIWHGLMPKDEHGLLVIQLTHCGDHIKCIVRDNGLGRTGSWEKKSRRKSEHESVAMEVTEARIKLFNRKHGKKIDVHITDLAANGRPDGTEVQFSLPLLEE